MDSNKGSWGKCMQGETSTKLEFRLFGTFEVIRNGQPLSVYALGRPKTQTLLKVLLSERGKVFTQEQLIELLFPDADPQKSISNLQARISECRRLLEPHLKQGRQSRFIQNAGKGKYVFTTHAPCSLDIESFQELVFQGQQAFTQWDWPVAVKHFQQADTLYREDFLFNDVYEEWTASLRTSLKHLRTGILIDLSQAHAHLGQHAQAVAIVRRALTISPYDEHIYRLKMLFHVLQGEKSKALKTYQQAQDVFKREFKTGLTRNTNVLCERILQNERLGLADLVQRGERQPGQRRHTTSQRVQALLRKSEYLINKRTTQANKTALKYLKQAQGKAPGNPRILAAQARVYSTLAWHYEDYDLNVARAKECVRQAMDIDPFLPETHVTHHFIRMCFFWDFEGIEVWLTQWITRLPHYASLHQWKGWWLSIQGRHQEAALSFEQAVNLNPLDTHIYIAKAFNHYLAGEADHMIDTCGELLELEPTYTEGHRFLALGYELKGSMNRAKKYANTLIHFDEINAMDVCAQAYVLSQSGDTMKSKALLRQVQSSNSASPYHQAVAHMANNEMPQAINLLRLARRQHSWPLLTARLDPRLKRACRDNIHPQLQAFLFQPAVSSTV